MKKLIVVAVLAVAFALFARPAASADEDVIHLFNGKDLTNFYTFFPKLGKDNDPEKVFTVQDGVIHVSGTVFGYLATEKEYENYHLVVEFKWGEKTGPRRKDQARDSGVLLHATGPDGAGGWMKSIECQMIEGGTGDFIMVKGKKQPKLTVTAEQRTNYKPKEHLEWYYNPKAPAKEFTGRVNWYGRDPN